MTGPTPGETRQFGAQIAWIEEPDVFAMRLSGEIDGPSLSALLAYQTTWLAEKGHVFVLCDLSGVTGATTEARRVLQAKRLAANRITHLCFGARFTARVLAEMVVRAARFLGAAPPGMEVLFFETEAEARAHMRHVRDTMDGKKA
jgi:hypothetical protein